MVEQLFRVRENVSALGESKVLDQENHVFEPFGSKVEEVLVAGHGGSRLSTGRMQLGFAGARRRREQSCNSTYGCVKMYKRSLPSGVRAERLNEYVKSGSRHQTVKPGFATVTKAVNRRGAAVNERQVPDEAPSPNGSIPGLSVVTNRRIGGQPPSTNGNSSRRPRHQTVQFRFRTVSKRGQFDCRLLLPTSVHAPLFAESRIASRINCVRSASRKSGMAGLPVERLSRKSATWWVKLCSYPI